MLSIRFSRKGKKKYPVYRIIITERSKDPFGDYIETFGTYNPHTKEAKIDVERIKYWLERGAQATATVHNLLVTKGIVKADKVRASKAKTGKKKRAQIEIKKAEEAAAKKAEEAAKAEEAKKAQEAAQAEQAAAGVEAAEAKEADAQPVEEKTE